MKKPIPKYGCEGGYNADAEGQPHAKKRPFTHASTGRDNWRRTVRKRQRREAKSDISDAFRPKIKEAYAITETLPLRSS